ncbi:hypothetical protein A9P82_05690 [Arachidicoccus ginsenosidimutans]|nr:hypothetical protein A9P82_05690 [Arachidicoccus sp. BS20]
MYDACGHASWRKIHSTSFPTFHLYALQINIVIENGLYGAFSLYEFHFFKSGKIFCIDIFQTPANYRRCFSCTYPEDAPQIFR